MKLYYLLCFLPLIVVLVSSNRKKRRVLTQLINKKGVNTNMKDMAQMFIGKECIIDTYDSQIVGTVREVSDGAILIENASGLNEAVNLSYVCRIREYPRKKNGKKKSVVLD